MKNAESQVLWLQEKLNQHNFKIQNRLGKLHNNTDALSRQSCNQLNEGWTVEHCI